MNASQPQSERINLFDLDRAGLVSFFEAHGEKSFRASQTLKWVYHQRELAFDRMSNLSVALREKLSDVAEFRLPKIVTEQRSNDGTVKWLLELSCGNRIETVFIPEDHRGTLCISSQVGCALACTFCSTAQQGFNRNLSVGEIVGQVWLAIERLGDAQTVTNIVLMGMGEPLLNFNNVVSATNLMKEDLAFGLAKRRITLSTAGVVPAIDRLGEATDLSLAVSLHAPNNPLRDKLVPLNKKYPIEELIPACKRYADRFHKAKITIEYVMLNGVNDDVEHAHELVRVLNGLPCKVNLIPFNPFPNSIYRCSSNNAIHRFRNILIEKGVVTVTRKTRGEDIDAACGQLVGLVDDKSRRHVKLQKQLQ